MPTQVSATITAGAGASALGQNLTVSPNKLYIANQGAGTVTIARMDTNAVVATTTVGTNPTAVYTNGSAGFTFVANAGDRTISKIDATTNAVTATLTPTLTGYINDLAAQSPAANSRYFVSQYNGVTAYTSSGDVEQSLSLICNGKMAVNTTTNQAYVLDVNLNQVAVLNVSSGGLSLVGYLPLRACVLPSAIAVNTTTRKVFIAGLLSNTITVLDGGATAATMPTIDKTIEYGMGYPDMLVNPSAIGVNPTTNMIYVTSSNTPNLFIIDGSTSGSTYYTTRNLNIGFNPVALAIDSTNNRVYVITPTGDIVKVTGASAANVNTAAVAVTLTSTGANPSKVITNAITNLTYVSNNAGNNVTVTLNT